jgi:hypothetical protein
MTGVSAEAWTQLTTTAGAGSAAPPPTRSLNLNDVTAFVELNFGDFYDPNSEIADCSITAAGTTAGGIAIRDGSMPGWVRDYGLCDIFGSGAPTASTGQNKAQKGSKYTDLSAGELYINKGTAGTPAWHKITTA